MILLNKYSDIYDIAKKEIARLKKSLEEKGYIDKDLESKKIDLTAYENIKMQYDILGIKDYRTINDLLKLVGLENTGKKMAKNFSLGMRQRLGIAVALCGSPEFLALDEPINGLDPEGIVEIRKLIKKLNKERNITILISSHILDELSRVATHYGFIADGKIIKEMSAEEFEEDCKKSINIITNKSLSIFIGNF